MSSVIYGFIVPFNEITRVEITPEECYVEKPLKVVSKPAVIAYKYKEFTDECLPFLFDKILGFNAEYDYYSSNYVIGYGLDNYNHVSLLELKKMDDDLLEKGFYDCKLYIIDED